eukprot:scaffold4278_cov129-Isochrysis_galbana.AAC.3
MGMWRACYSKIRENLSLGAAKFRPITVTDVQSDGRPLALPGDSPRARHMYALQWRGCRATFVMAVLFYNNGSTTTCPTSTRARSRSFNLEMLTFVGLLGPSCRNRTASRQEHSLYCCPAGGLACLSAARAASPPWQRRVETWRAEVTHEERGRRGRRTGRAHTKSAFSAHTKSAFSAHEERF